ncbi:hypothetical protein P152DRAFT_397929 [Eremomyces bilateralis CBS 781.70]|uniref:HECT-type E3 ubiquitin transferase n=1 Tax=Eremomyces bilateralis CBS 781.70 TaxID=1392243 RepID=A0A6G1G1X1_9PEZI|nr:uncharacterized protein P152DRAFT_397929 [Eremomyces bilateralis CBS 781.70]KAF1812107.1 hypothetical protein P152DRAFT_397929 [Eremomyces bilateralis CBS 781.70]
MALNTVNHALQASLSSWPTLLKCFRESPGVDSVYKTPNKCSLSYFRAVEKANCFSMWPSLNGSLILDSLWHPLRALYNPPSELSAQGQRSPKLRAQSRSSSFSAQPSPQTATRPPRSNVPSGRYLTDEEAAHIIMVCLQAMFGRGGIMQTWLGNKYFYEGRALGRTYAVDSVQGKSPDIGYIDEIDHEPTRRLFRAVVRALGVRRCFDEIAKTTGKSEATPARSPNPLEIEEEVHSHCKVLKLILEYFVVGKKDLRKIPCQDGVLLVAKASPSARRHIAYVYTFIDMLQSIILYEWDGKAELHRWSPVGAAIDILADIYKDRDLWGIPAERFAMQYIPNRLDPISTPLSYISWNRTPNTSHLLSFPFLFPKPIITAYFRTVTFSSLSNAYNAATYTKNLFEKWGHEVSHESDFPDAHENRQDYLESRMSRAMTRMLYLDCKRGTVLQDAFTQLWGRELRELKRPLKVQLGFGEGEEGLDHGGVSQEFFGVVFGPAFVEDAGLFVTDKRSQMTYFRPLSPASLDHFELVGLLVGLALYNGCTIPINFPQAVYRKLLGQPVDRIEHIKDGWQELAQGFEQLLLWGSRPGQEEDVSEVFMREYIYTFDCISGPVDVDMNAIDRDKVWPDLLKEATESVAIMVDNSNRKRYVQDYIYWMIHKSVEPAYEAFEDGFYTVIDRRAVSMLSPEHLAVLMAGHSNLSAIGLYRAATYEEGYSRYHQTILDFWQIVMAFDEKKLRRLLEFVTACDRVPVNGIEDVAFCIVRNGSDSDRIPQSMTCYGKLLLPQYDSKAKLNEKLNVALENSLGFGAA